MPRYQRRAACSGRLPSRDRNDNQRAFDDDSDPLHAAPDDPWLSNRLSAHHS